MKVQTCEYHPQHPHLIETHSSKSDKQITKIASSVIASTAKEGDFNRKTKMKDEEKLKGGCMAYGADRSEAGLNGACCAIL